MYFEMKVPWQENGKMSFKNSEIIPTKSETKHSFHDQSARHNALFCEEAQEEFVGRPVEMS